MGAWKIHVRVRKHLLPRLFSLKGAVTMTTVTLQSAMNPKHTDNFAGCIDSLPRPSLVTAPVFSVESQWYWNRLPGF
ncbi:hypothetical protein [Hyalangium minutum]|uniref:hypothetical protein n=1 Tax=Hyalangium minutum TaxID=394096 RepID=UPI0012FA38E5|nr:hypothetical protein [Hyalangium minutum]